MLRLRVTDLDAWVRFVEPEREEFEVSLEDFVASMRRTLPPTIDMDCGKAFHSMLEKAALGQVLDGVEVDGFTFDFRGNFSLTLPTERETSVEKVYQTEAGPVLLRGKLDGIDGQIVTDYKLTTSPFDAERYAESLQWKAYLDMTGARQFQYLVFQARRNDNHVDINGIHPLTFWSYPEMSEEVSKRVGELAAFVAVHVPEMMPLEVAGV